MSPSCGSPAWGDWWNQNQTSLLHICQCFPLAEGDRKPEGKGAHGGHPVCGGGLIRGPAAGWPTCLGRGECLYTQVSAWSSSPCKPAFFQREVCWVDSWHLYLPFGARRRENWKERLWVGVWPVPESPSWRRQGCVWLLWLVGSLSEKGPSVGSGRGPVILGGSGPIHRASSRLPNPHLGLCLPYARPQSLASAGCGESQIRSGPERPISGVQRQTGKEASTLYHPVATASFLGFSCFALFFPKNILTRTCHKCGSPLTSSQYSGSVGLPRASMPLARCQVGSEADGSSPWRGPGDTGC